MTLNLPQLNIHNIKASGPKQISNIITQVN